MENTLTLYVRYLAKPGCRETFLRQLTTHGIIDAIRREDGCLRYDYFLSVQNADEILLVEQWQRLRKKAAQPWKSCGRISKAAARRTCTSSTERRRICGTGIWRS